MAKKLSDKQEMFCQEYIIDMNATRSAIAAGYSEKTARQIGYTQLTKDYIQEYLQELMKKRVDRLKIDQDYVLKNIVEVQQRCMQQVPVMVFNKETKEYEQAQDDDGNNIWQFDPSNANKSLDMLGKHTGFYKEDNLQSKSDNNSVQKVYITDNQQKAVEQHVRKAIEGK